MASARAAVRRRPGAGCSSPVIGAPFPQCRHARQRASPAKCCSAICWTRVIERARASGDGRTRPAAARAVRRTRWRRSAATRRAEGRCFHAADVLDRVLEIEQHLRAASASMDERAPRLSTWSMPGRSRTFHDRDARGRRAAVIDFVSPLSGSAASRRHAALAGRRDGRALAGGRRHPLSADRIAKGWSRYALDHLDRGLTRRCAGRAADRSGRWWTGPADRPGRAEAAGARARHAVACARRWRCSGWGRWRLFRLSLGDPTYLAGLALLEAHWRRPHTAFELACGIGHYLRELRRRGVACVGADVVFAKCWLAQALGRAGGRLCRVRRRRAVADRRRAVRPRHCHDAFYFLEQTRRSSRQRLRAARRRRARDQPRPQRRSSRSARRARPDRRRMARAVPRCDRLCDEELLRALLAGVRPPARVARRPRTIEAWSHRRRRRHRRASRGPAGSCPSALHGPRQSAAAATARPTGPPPLCARNMVRG